MNINIEIVVLIVLEALRIRRDYPEMSDQEVAAKAKELYVFAKQREASETGPFRKSEDQEQSCM